MSVQPDPDIPAVTRVTGATPPVPPVPPDRLGSVLHGPDGEAYRRLRTLLVLAILLLLAVSVVTGALLPAP